ncbi:MAG: TPM domain-containing protein [Desulfovibrionaceae bacterium]|jgi:hypothetical protein|nr:TPM domain-containing protein [Desulfovibrionaceae bacterium]
MGLFFHFGRGQRPPLVRGSTFGERFLRFMLLVLVFAVSGYGFYWNNTRVIETMSARSSVYDPAKLLGGDERDALLDFVKLFKDEFGMTLRIVVSEEAVALPELDSKTVFVGVAPATGQILVELPPLAVKALGPDFVTRLQSETFPPYYEKGEWKQGLVVVLKTVWQGLIGGA